MDGASAMAKGVVPRREIGEALHALCEVLLAEVGVEDTKALKSLGKVRASIAPWLVAVDLDCFNDLDASAFITLLKPLDLP